VPLHHFKHHFYVMVSCAPPSRVAFISIVFFSALDRSPW